MPPRCRRRLPASRLGGACRPRRHPTQPCTCADEPTTQPRTRTHGRTHRCHEPRLLRRQDRRRQPLRVHQLGAPIHRRREPPPVPVAVLVPPRDRTSNRELPPQLRYLTHERLVLVSNLEALKPQPRNRAAGRINVLGRRILESQLDRVLSVMIVLDHLVHFPAVRHATNARIQTRHLFQVDAPHPSAAMWQGITVTKVGLPSIGDARRMMAGCASDRTGPLPRPWRDQHEGLA